MRKKYDEIKVIKCKSKTPKPLPLRGKSRDIKVHEIKILPEYFKAVARKEKRFELRKNDREYQVGDLVLLREWVGTKYTENEKIVRIKYILKDCPEYGLADGYCIFGW